MKFSPVIFNVQVSTSTLDNLTAFLLNPLLQTEVSVSDYIWQPQGIKRFSLYFPPAS